jgi:hypothetical protein
MYVKIFAQILDSSLAYNYDTRHVFMDLLVLADTEGIVDMTHEAIARRTNAPIDLIKGSISELEEPDPSSHIPEEEGRRLVRLDDHRNWGWRIVNYKVYREMRDKEAMRAYFRDYKRRQRLSKKVLDIPTSSNGVKLSPAKVRHAEAEADTEEEKK